MTRRTLAALLALVIGTSGAGAQAGRSTPPPPSDPAAVRRSVQAMLAAFQRYSAAAQWDSLLTLYADDPHFLFIENGTLRTHSVADIRGYFAKIPPNTRIEHTYTDTEINPLAPGVATVVTKFQTRFVDASGFTFGGMLSMTLVYRGGGWRILEGHSSTPVSRGS